LKEDLMTLPFAREISLRVMSVLRNNFRLTVGINSAVLLMAITGLASPLAAAILHNGSTIGLLAYALAATNLRPKGEPEAAEAIS
jgi:manganese/zinc-transporting P-type ATPase C